MIKNKKILVTGATGQVARPIAHSLAKDNEVWCAARFSEPHLRKELEAEGIKTVAWTLGSDDFSGMPKDFNYVIHSAANVYPVANDYDGAISSNAEGTGLLMNHCRTAEAFLYVSSMCAYETPDAPNTLCDERKSPLGSHPSYAPSYGIGKVATEAVVRALARTLKLPTIIARLGMAYGRFGHGGVPTLHFKTIQADQPVYIKPTDYYMAPIHEEDLILQVEPLLKAASIPAAIVNWVSDEIVSERELIEYICKIAGKKPNIIFEDNQGYGCTAVGDPAFRNKLTGPAKWTWKKGVLESLKTNFPKHKFTDAA